MADSFDRLIIKIDTNFEGYDDIPFHNILGRNDNENHERKKEKSIHKLLLFNKGRGFIRAKMKHDKNQRKQLKQALMSENTTTLLEFFPSVLAQISNLEAEAAKKAAQAAQATADAAKNIEEAAKEATDQAKTQERAHQLQGTTKDNIEHKNRIHNIRDIIDLFFGDLQQIELTNIFNKKQYSFIIGSHFWDDTYLKSKEGLEIKVELKLLTEPVKNNEASIKKQFECDKRSQMIHYLWNKLLDPGSATSHFFPKIKPPNVLTQKSQIINFTNDLNFTSTQEMLQFLQQNKESLVEYKNIPKTILDSNDETVQRELAVINAYYFRKTLDNIPTNEKQFQFAKYVILEKPERWTQLPLIWQDVTTDTKNKELLEIAYRNETNQVTLNEIDKVAKEVNMTNRASEYISVLNKRHVQG